MKGFIASAGSVRTLPGSSPESTLNISASLSIRSQEPEVRGQKSEVSDGACCASDC
jgi:hypothetical protein